MPGKLKKVPNDLNIQAQGLKSIENYPPPPSYIDGCFFLRGHHYTAQNPLEVIEDTIVSVELLRCLLSTEPEVYGKNNTMHASSLLFFTSTINHN